MTWKGSWKCKFFTCFFINAFLTEIFRFYQTFFVLSWNMFRLCLVKKRTTEVFSLVAFKVKIYIFLCFGTPYILSFDWSIFRPPLVEMLFIIIHSHRKQKWIITTFKFFISYCLTTFFILFVFTSLLIAFENLLFKKIYFGSSQIEVHSPPPGFWLSRKTLTYCLTGILHIRKNIHEGQYYY